MREQNALRQEREIFEKERTQRRQLIIVERGAPLKKQIPFSLLSKNDSEQKLSIKIESFFVTFQKLRIIYKEKMRRTVYVAE